MTSPTPTPAAISLQDVASRARVSRTTVSMALRDHPKINADTRARVQEAARALGYRPNPLVAAHMAHIRAPHPPPATQCLAFLSNRPLAAIRADHRTPAWKYHDGAARRAAALGFRLEPLNLGGPGMTKRRIVQALAERAIAGVIVAPLSEGGGIEARDLPWERLAAAVLEHTLIEPRLHTVCSDEFSTIGRLIQRMLDYGYQRIGIAMHGRMDEHANHFWLAGFRTYVALARPSPPIPHFITSRWTCGEFLRWFRRHRPDAIITVNDEAVRWLREAGVRVPGEVGCGTIYWKEDRPFLSGYYQNHELMGAGAVDLVVEQLNRNERGVPAESLTLLVQAAWREGATLPRRSQPDARSPFRVWTR